MNVSWLRLSFDVNECKPLHHGDLSAEQKGALRGAAEGRKTPPAAGAAEEAEAGADTRSR
jgi:hypothetical protein